MSAKSDKAIRSALRSYKLPSHPTQTINHVRRISQLIKKEGISVEVAVARYTQRIGMVPKPKGLEQTVKKIAAINRANNDTAS